MRRSLVTLALIALVFTTTLVGVLAQAPGGGGGGGGPPQATPAAANCVGPSDPGELRVELLDGHDKYSPPAPEQAGQPVAVAIETKLGMVESVSDKTGSIRLVISHEIKWSDTRLAFNTSARNNGCFQQRRTMYESSMLDDIWTPKYYFFNQINRFGSSFQFFDIFDEGEVTVRTREGVHASCTFDFQKMPFDEQTCHLRMVMNAPNALVVFKQLQDGETSLFSEMNGGVVGGTTEWEIVETSSSSGTTDTQPPGSYVDFIIKIKRRPEYWVYFLIVPSMFLVALSYGTFWIQRGAVPARAAFCFISFLTVINLTNGALANLPKISPGEVYLLGVMSASTYFCAYTIVEVVASNVLLHIEVRVNNALKEYEELLKKADDFTDLGKDIRDSMAELGIDEAGKKSQNIPSVQSFVRSRAGRMGRQLIKKDGKMLISDQHVDVASRWLFPVAYAVAIGAVNAAAER